MLIFGSGLIDNPPALIAFLLAVSVALVVGLSFHECCHAWMAKELGDDTAARQGRLTLNPVAHIDPFGALMMFLIGFGYAKPTPVNPYRLSLGPKAGNALVAVAGPVSNFVIATLCAIPLRLGWIDAVGSFEGITDASGEEILGLFIFFILYINVVLGIFNLIPIHPLDGFKVLVGILPGELSRQVQSLAPYGPGILMTLIVVSWIAPPQYNVLGRIFDTVGTAVFRLLL
ncbi:MAG: site-2 protease family protein [Dehalococcoidia bacterium]